MHTYLMTTKGINLRFRSASRPADVSSQMRTIIEKKAHILFGILPALTFTKDAPFCTRDLKVKIATVKDGKYRLAAPGWIPVPTDIRKW